MSGCFGVSGFADQFLAHSAGWKQPGLFVQASGFFGEAFFKGLGWFETAALVHGNFPCACGS